MAHAIFMDNLSFIPEFMQDIKNKLAGVIVLYYLSLITLSAQSEAHELSAFAIIDPAYSPEQMFPAPVTEEGRTKWVYGASELECHRLQVLQQRKDSAKLNVGYPGVFHKPYTSGSFRMKLRKPQKIRSIVFRTSGSGVLYVNDLKAGTFPETDSIHTVALGKSTEISQIRFDLETLNEPVALFIEEEGFSTSLDNWEWKHENGTWETAFHFPGSIDKKPPHRLEDPEIVVKPEAVSADLYDFGRELFGYITIRSVEKPVISAGESEAEALDVSNPVKEQSAEMVRISSDEWRSEYPLALRYLFARDKKMSDVSCNAVFHPVSYRGAFACSDTMLTRIWMNSAYTLRLCMHDFMLDGIKRDRLPWAGDLAMSLLVNAFTFYDKEMIRRTLVALGRAGIREKDINGIIDYSLWWIIAQDQYQLYFDDPLHLSREWSRIRDALNDLSARCDADGFLIPAKDNWLFIDWVEQEKWTALQILWWWAQKSGARLATRVDDSISADYWINSSAGLEERLSEAAWSKKDQIWLSGKEPGSENTRHPNFLAVISGISSSDHYAGIKELLVNSSVRPVGTPYMAGFEVMALNLMGNTGYMLKHVKEYWGAMLKAGASSFWEAYDVNGSPETQYSYYGRPYGKSLCHAWSAGPAAFLPSGLFGLRPTEDGWKSFTLDPGTGGLDWASVCVPTRYGNITVDIEKNDIRISVPEGITMEWKGKLFRGGSVVRDKL